MNSIYAKNPCRHCKPPERYPGCHGVCDKRQEWIKEFRDKQDQIYTEKNKVARLDTYEKDMATKRKKRNGKEK